MVYELFIFTVFADNCSVADFIAAEILVAICVFFVSKNASYL